jgi:CRISPR-associated protein Cas5 subtype I-B
MKRTFVAFDVEGHIAHFRCIYSNVASLTYSFPPRNTIAGMVAAILGFERENRTQDGYYGNFQRSRCGIALRIITPIRKLQLSLNYLDTGSRGEVDPKKIRGLTARKQIPIEYVVAEPPQTTVKYRIYFTHEDEGLLENLKKRIAAHRVVYPLSLGPTYCTARPMLVNEETEKKEVELADQGRSYSVVTVLPEQILDVGKFDYKAIEGILRAGQSLKIMSEENLPPDFGPGRVPVQSGGGIYYYEASGRPLPAMLKAVEIFRVRDGYGVFM